MNNENQNLNSEVNNDFFVPEVEPIQIIDEQNTVEPIKEDIPATEPLEIKVEEPVLPTPVVEEPVVENVVLEPEVVVAPSVEPVEEVKIEEEQEVVPTKVKKLPASEKHPKLTTFFLTFFFILLFVYIMAMPYVDEWVQKMKENKNNTDTNEVVNENKQTQPVTKQEELKILTCTLAKTPTESYTETIIETFEYNKDNKIVNSSKTHKYKFTQEDASYQALSKECTDSLKYLGNPGFTISCTNQDLEIVIGNEFELKTFKPIKDGEKTITSNANYNDSIETIKTNLTTIGYICE